VVPSPKPLKVIQRHMIRESAQADHIVIAAGGGGIPTIYEPGADRKLIGVECVIDKDLASELLARELGADFFVMLTDAEAVYVDWGQPTRRAIRRASPAALARLDFAAGSMGPKVEAACRFASRTGKPAAIGALEDVARILEGEAGTLVTVGDDQFVFGD
jgi:carbamate kinase